MELNWILLSRNGACVTFRQGIAHIQDRHQVVDVAVDALSYTRILETNAEKQMRTTGSVFMCVFSVYLDFHGHFSAVLQPGQVNLPDGGCCEGTLLKQIQLVSPVGTQIAVQCFLQIHTKRFCFLIYINQDRFMVLEAGTENLLSFAWLAWSQHSVGRDQRSWQVEGWWKRHLKSKNRRFCCRKKNTKYCFAATFVGVADSVNN